MMPKKLVLDMAGEGNLFSGQDHAQMTGLWSCSVAFIGAKLPATKGNHAVFTDSQESMLAAEATHRDHAIAREGHRRVEGRPARALVFRTDQREHRIAGPGGDLVQPDPCRRDPGLEVPRPGHHRHDPRPAHRRARPHRPLSPPAPSSPTRAVTG